MSKDTIYRQDAIDALVKAIREDPYYDSNERINGLGVCDVRVVINDLPSAQPEQRWIPCSETIDIPENEVLCCDRYGNEMIGYLAYTDEQWLCESDAEMMYDPIAWMEKPKPWRGEAKCTNAH